MAVRQYKWLFISLFLLAVLPARSGVGNFHPFYIAVTEINHNLKDRILEVSVKMFADDFEKTLEQGYKQPVDLNDSRYRTLLDKEIPDYIQHHLSLSVDGKLTSLHYIGYEKEKESVFIYLQADNISSLKKMDVTNSLLYEFNNTQINIVHAIVNGKRQSTKLDFPNKLASFSW